MIRIFPLVSRGRACPRCGSRAGRVHTPLLLRPFRALLLSDAVRRRCDGQCGWRGFSLPAQEPAHGVPDADHEPLHQI